MSVVWEKSLKISHFEKLLVTLITSADVGYDGTMWSIEEVAADLEYSDGMAGSPPGGHKKAPTRR